MFQDERRMIRRKRTPAIPKNSQVIDVSDDTGHQSCTQIPPDVVVMDLCSSPSEKESAETNGPYGQFLYLDGRDKELQVSKEDDIAPCHCSRTFCFGSRYKM